MTIDELLQRCPQYTRVLFCERLRSRALFTYGAPGDAVELTETRPDGAEGARITALVLERVDAGMPSEPHNSSDEGRRRFPNHE